MNNILIKQSEIHGTGLFAGRDFKKDEIVLKWKPKILHEKDIAALSKNERRFIFKVGEDKYYFMQEPERFMNHSCENNTTVQNDSDVAIRDIKAG